MAGKYLPLEQYLRDQSATQSEIKISFEEIEKILKSKLPASAYEDNRWWEHFPLCPSDISPKCRSARNLGEENME